MGVTEEDFGWLKEYFHTLAELRHKVIYSIFGYLRLNGISCPKCVSSYEVF